MGENRSPPPYSPAAVHSVSAAGRGALGVGPGMVWATPSPTRAGGSGKTAAAFGDRVYRYIRPSTKLFSKQSTRRRMKVRILSGAPLF